MSVRIRDDGRGFDCSVHGALHAVRQVDGLLECPACDSAPAPARTAYVDLTPIVYVGVDGDASEPLRWTFACQICDKRFGLTHHEHTALTQALVHANEHLAERKADG